MLYKYAGWNENTKNNLSEHQLWFNTPDNFNDPFDIVAYYSHKNNEAIEKIRSSMGDSIGIFDNKDILEVQKLIEWEKGYHTRYGITCFSCNEPENILLWSHYAENHTGICLGFEVGDNDENASDFMPILKNRQEFSGKLLKMIYVSHNQRPKQSDSNLLLKKFNIWGYENEYRVMVRSEAPNFFPAAIKYKKDKLKKIILGARFQIFCLSELMDCLNSYKDVMIDFDMVLLDDVEYKLRTEELSINELNTICKNVHDSCDVKYDNYLTNIIHDLRSRYSEGIIKKAWNNAFKCIPLCVCQKFFPMVKRDNFWEKTGSSYLPKSEVIEIGLFRSYMEKQTEFEADKLNKKNQEKDEVGGLYN